RFFFPLLLPPDFHLNLFLAAGHDQLILVRRTLREDLIRDGVLQHGLNRSLKRSGAKCRIIAFLCHKLYRTVLHVQPDSLLPHSGRQFFDLKICDPAHIFLLQRMEYNDLIQAVDKLRTEGHFYSFHHTVLYILFPAFFLTLFISCKSERAFSGDLPRSDVGCHDDDRIFKAHCPSLGVCEMSVIQDLKECIPYIRMRFLDLIKEDNAVWFSRHHLRALSALVIASISRWGSDQLGDGILLYLFGH